MAITSDNLKFFEAQYNTDNQNGGGFITNKEITSFDSTEIFQPTSELSQIYGLVNYRKIFAKVDTRTTEPLLGSYVFLAKPPSNKNVNMFLQKASSAYDVVSKARSLAEGYFGKSAKIDLGLIVAIESGQRSCTFIGGSANILKPDQTIILEEGLKSEAVKIRNASFVEKEIYVNGAYKTFYIYSVVFWQAIENNFSPTTEQDFARNVNHTFTVYSVFAGANASFYTSELLQNDVNKGDKKVAVNDNRKALAPVAATEVNTIRDVDFYNAPDFSKPLIARVGEAIPAGYFTGFFSQNTAKMTSNSNSLTSNFPFPSKLTAISSNFKISNNRIVRVPGSDLNAFNVTVFGLKESGSYKNFTSILSGEKGGVTYQTVLTHETAYCTVSWMYDGFLQTTDSQANDGVVISLNANVIQLNFKQPVDANTAIVISYLPIVSNEFAMTREQQYYGDWYNSIDTYQFIQEINNTANLNNISTYSFTKDGYLITKNVSESMYQAETVVKENPRAFTQDDERQLLSKCTTNLLVAQAKNVRVGYVSKYLSKSVINSIRFGSGFAYTAEQIVSMASSFTDFDVYAVSVNNTLKIVIYPQTLNTIVNKEATEHIFLNSSMKDFDVKLKEALQSLSSTLNVSSIQYLAGSTFIVSGCKSGTKTAFTGNYTRYQFNNGAKIQGDNAASAQSFAKWENNEISFLIPQNAKIESLQINFNIDRPVVINVKDLDKQNRIYSQNVDNCFIIFDEVTRLLKIIPLRSGWGEHVQKTLKIGYTESYYAPIEKNLVNIDSSRLQADGKVPVYQAGDVAILYQSRLFPIPSVGSGITVSSGINNVTELKVVDSKGVYMSESMYTENTANGTLTFKSSVSTAGLSSPLSLEVIESEINIISSSSQYEINLQNPVLRSYKKEHNAIFGSCLLLGEIRAGLTNSFSMTPWASVFSDVNTSVMSARYDFANFPIEIYNNQSVTERYAFVFTGSTTFNVVSDGGGVVASGNTSTDFELKNPATGEVIFKILRGGWGTGWSAGNALRINIKGGCEGIWLVRSTQRSEEVTTDGDKFCIMLKGDATKG